MLLIIGLGNPGKQYEDTPHNSGYMFVNMLREYLLENSNLQVSEWNNEKRMLLSDVCEVKKNGKLILVLQRPLTYMNNSGSAVAKVFKRYKPKEYILVHDDLDIPLGSFKIQKGKSPKGHNGILSVEGVLVSKDFLRVRLGIENRGKKEIAGEEYVLIPYTKKELAILHMNISEGILTLVSGYLQL